MSTVDADSCESKIIVREILHSEIREARRAEQHSPKCTYV